MGSYLALRTRKKCYQLLSNAIRYYLLAAALECTGFLHALGVDLCFLNYFPLVSGRSSAYGDATAEGHPAGPGSVSSSTGAISTTTGHQEGDGSEGEGEGEAEGDVHTSNRSKPSPPQLRDLPI